MRWKTIFITANCEQVLRQLRRKDHERALWVDSICINQESIEERSVQINLMGDVNELAERTLIWLGPSDKFLDALYSEILRLPLIRTESTGHSRSSRIWVSTFKKPTIRNQHLPFSKLSLVM